MTPDTRRGGRTAAALLNSRPMRTSTNIKLILGIILLLLFGGLILSVALKVAAFAMKSVLVLLIVLVGLAWFFVKRK
jgi:hypothetical protein